MGLRLLVFGVFGVLLIASCGGEEKTKTPKAKVVSGFSFSITVDPSTFVPASLEAVRVASDGSPDSNPPNTVELYTPNDTLGWQDGAEVNYFSFDVNMTSFYEKKLCSTLIVVDRIAPEAGRFFVLDDREEYAESVTGAGIWGYGDLAHREKETRRWTIALKNKKSFTLTGRVLADDGACGESP